jgi:hypothetical protein
MAGLRGMREALHLLWAWVVGAVRDALMNPI